MVSFFFEKGKLHNMCSELKRASLVGMMLLYVFLLAPQDPFSIYRYYYTKGRSGLLEFIPAVFRQRLFTPWTSLPVYSGPH